MIHALTWVDGKLELIDQTKLPDETVFLQISKIEEIFDAIQTLKVRGAPAIGIAAAYGLYYGMCESAPRSRDDFFAILQKNIDYLASARPTAVNLFWAMEDIKTKLQTRRESNIDRLKNDLLDLARELHEDDRKRCEGIADSGQEVIPQNARILTHCNTGALATGGIGTAFGVIYRAHQNGKNIQVYANETRPLLQGARLTVWELHNAGIPVHLVCDSMDAALMQQGKVDLIILGSDRIAADGSVANKIGTYSLAVLAKFHNIPFYAAAPLSTFDLSISQGKDIPIEIRDSNEIRNVFNKCPITVPDVPCWNPAFDVTPPDLVTGIITEKGVIYPPFEENIRKIFNP